ncbi:MAG: hypothetical protein M3Q18_04645, partial [Actinomycetota bacterium]|nr:hypothetical protein [Actinomycetota bacterium]
KLVNRRPHAGLSSQPHDRAGEMLELRRDEVLPDSNFASNAMPEATAAGSRGRPWHGRARRPRPQNMDRQ